MSREERHAASPRRVIAERKRALVFLRSERGQFLANFPNTAADDPLGRGAANAFSNGPLGRIRKLHLTTLPPPSAKIVPTFEPFVRDNVATTPGGSNRMAQRPVPLPKAITTAPEVTPHIEVVRGHRSILDSDLAAL